MRTEFVQPVRPPSMNPEERRRDPRFPAAEACIAHLDAFPGQPLATSVLNLSRNGMKLGLDRRVDVGSVIEVALGNYFVRGEVRYCIAAAEGFHAGILVTEATLVPFGSDRPIRV